MIQQIIDYFSPPTRLCVKCVYHHFDNKSYFTKDMEGYERVAGTDKECYIKCNRIKDVSVVTGASIYMDHSCEYERSKDSKGCGPKAKFYVYNQDGVLE